MYGLLGSIRDKCIAASPEKSRECITSLSRLNKCLQERRSAETDHMKSERKRLGEKLDNFDRSNSPSMKLFEEKGWMNLEFCLKLSIAMMLEVTGLDRLITREEKRRADVLFRLLDT